MKLYSVAVSVPLKDWFSFEQWAEQFRHWQALQALKLQVAQERKELAVLPDYILKDIGVSAGDAWLESQRSLDDLPKFRVKQALYGTDYRRSM